MSHAAAHRIEGKMAVIAFVERLDQVKTGSPQSGGNLRVGHPVPTNNVDGSSEEVIAVLNAADGAIMFYCPKSARDRPERGRYTCSGRGKCLGRLTGLCTMLRMRRS